MQSILDLINSIGNSKLAANCGAALIVCGFLYATGERVILPMAHDLINVLDRRLGNIETKLDAGCGPVTKQVKTEVAHHVPR